MSLKRQDKSFRQSRIISALLLVLVTSPAFARDAAFQDPGMAGSNSDEAVKIEPKNDIDTGESTLNVARRTTLFFVNQTNQPVKVEKLAVNNDGNVSAEISNDDCSKQGEIPPLSRCSMEVSVTPASAGPWTVNVLMTHNAAGRIARVKLNGKTSGGGGPGDKKDTGLTLSSKDINPVNFGDVEVAQGKAVRSALMINDSPEAITIYSIDVIEADSNLQRLEQGCAIDMELKPGESCPVTMVWMPKERGQISTDLIIRHSGKLGFAVIPIRGNAKGTSVSGNESRSDGKSTQAASSPSTSATTATPVEMGRSSSPFSLPPPPSPAELEAAAGNIPPVAAETLTTAATPAFSGVLRLIGTVGNRVVILKPDGTTAVANVGEEFDVGEAIVKVTAVSSRSAEVVIDGKKKSLTLGAAPELVRSGGSSSARAEVSIVPAEPAAAGGSVPLPSAGATTTPKPTANPTPAVTPILPPKSTTGAGPTQ